LLEGDVLFPYGAVSCNPYRTKNYNLYHRYQLPMADVMLVGGGITELQLLEAQIQLLNKQVDGVKRAENASIACARVIASIQKAEEKDGFVGGPAITAADGTTTGGPAAGGGGAGQPNQYHSGAAGNGGSGGGGGAEGGCCTLL
jgi:hypothetical protein